MAVETANLHKMADYESLGLLHEMFTRQANLTPERTAVVSPDGRTLTFEQLEAKSSLLAKRLLLCGVKVDTCVAIYMDKSIEFVIAYIAILKAGGAYLPVDTSYPSQLIADVLEDAEPVAIVTTPDFYSTVREMGQCLVLGEGWEASLELQSAATTVPPPPGHQTLDSLAYVVYSSGTTGRPKGILCPHRGAVFSYHWRHVHYPYREDDREACNIFFVWEMLRPLLKGIPMYIIPNHVIYDPVLLCSFLHDNRITRILVTPSLLETVINTDSVDIPQALSTLREVIFCGEVVTMALFERCLKLLPWTQFLNLYSVSECHDVTCVNLTEHYRDNKLQMTSRKFCPVGRLLEGVHVVILKDGGKPQHVGEPGEIYVGGPTLARGYLKRPELHAARFVARPDTVPANYGPVLYRTGDWGYLLSDGSMEICGRCDSMVKIRGYSVEVQAVEAALLSLPSVNACVVTVQGEEGEDKFLLAYIVPEPDASKKKIRAALKTRLPFYMIPSYFIFLKSIPVLPASGKLDKKALPPLDQPSGVETEGLAVTATERAVAALWASLLQLKHVDTEESFFDLGGHSLLAAELLNRLRQEFPVALSVQDLFSQPTVASLARLIDARLTNTSQEPSPTAALDLQSEVRLHDQGYLNLDIQLRAFWRTLHHGHHFQKGRLLLTGAAGFLGSFLLRELLLHTNLKVYVLIRELPGKDAGTRLRQSLQQFGILPDPNSGAAPTRPQALVQSLLPDRVTAIKGDVALASLGLSEEDYTYLSTDIDLIIHAAASVNLAYPYTALHGSNVVGSANILLFGRTGKIKPIHHISTDAVFPPGRRDCQESDTAAVYSDQLTDGYSQSKWVAEQLFHRARSRGLPISIYRLGNLSGDRELAQWNPQDFTLLILQECARSGLAPDVDWDMEMTPVDFAAEVIVQLLLDPESISQTFHIINTSPTKARWVFEWMNANRYPLKFVPFADWRNSVLEQLDIDGRRDQLRRLLETYIRDEAFFGQLSTFHRENLDRMLAKHSLAYPCLDRDLIEVYVDKMAARDVLPRPRRLSPPGARPLAGCVAVVTGASSGIGAAVAEALAGAGVRVALAARRGTRLQTLEAAIAGNGGVALAVATDVTKREQVAELVRHVEATLGPVDILVNCAGVMYYTLMKNGHQEEWDSQIDVNCRGTVNAVGALLPGMLDRGRGHIVNISSNAGRRGFPGLAVYSGTKFFIEGFSQSLRHEVADAGVKVTTIQPGDVQTEILSHTTDLETKAAYDLSSRFPNLTSQEVAASILYVLAQPDHVAVNEILIEPRQAPI